MKQKRIKASTKTGNKYICTQTDKEEKAKTERNVVKAITYKFYYRGWRYMCKDGSKFCI